MREKWSKPMSKLPYHRPGRLLDVDGGGGLCERQSLLVQLAQLLLESAKRRAILERAEQRVLETRIGHNIGLQAPVGIR